MKTFMAIVNYYEEGKGGELEVLAVDKKHALKALARNARIFEIIDLYEI